MSWSGLPETSRTSVAACAQAFRTRLAADRKAAADRAAELRRRALSAAGKLARCHGVKRVWLFGSLAWGEAHAGSDVDLLVEGLAAESWSAASALVEDEIDAPVDLVRIEEAPAGLEARVASQGVLLHGSP